MKIIAAITRIIRMNLHLQVNSKIRFHFGTSLFASPYNFINQPFLYKVLHEKYLAVYE